MAATLYNFLDSHLSATGDITNRDATITANRKDLIARKQALDDRMAVVQARYQKQFNALDQLLTQMQSTSSYLAKQLSAGTSG